MKKSILLTVICCLLKALTVTAGEPIPFDENHWNFYAKSYQVEIYKDRESLMFHDGLALVKNTEGFVNGIIEFDIAIPAKRGFSGPAAGFAAMARKLRAGAEKAEMGTVSSWEVSTAFPSEKLAGRHYLKDEEIGQLGWTILVCDPTGLANLARITGANDIQAGKNCVFAETKVMADQDTLKKLDIAFSDAVRVYLNGQILYEANDVYRSRDYRFLGTMGYFDAVYLPLKKGQNDIKIAVTEKMGGWGLRARFPDMTGISF